MIRKPRFVLIVLVVLGSLVVTIEYLRRTNIAVLEPAGTIGRQEKSLMVLALLLSLIVVVPVLILLFSFAWRYRVGNTKAKYSPNLDGNRYAETLWWLIPSALIVVLSVVTWTSTHRLDPYKTLADKNKLTIQVVALDWKWLFIYPKQNIATVNYIQIPVNTSVDFQITSDTVMNSFWVPQLGGQIYAMPGMETQLNLSASKIGNYAGSSANISGAGFAGMTFTTHASTMNDFSSWVASVQHSSTASLSAASYSSLAAPSQNNKPTVYSSTDQNLYDDIMMKYMMPMTAPSTTATPNQTKAPASMPAMSGMQM